MSDLHILMEYYQGNSKDKRFKICEEQLKKIIEKLKPEQDVNVRYNITRKKELLTFGPENKLLCATLADIFNMKKVNIYWEIGVVNAYTLNPNILSKILNNQNLNISDKFKKKNPMAPHIVVYEDLITIADLNEKELMAVILHELGHNYYMSPLFMLTEILSSTILLPSVKLIELLTYSNHKIKEYVYKHFPSVNNLFQVFNDVRSTIVDMLTIFGSIDILTEILSGKILLRIPTNPISVIDNLGRYGNEKGADTFAARYGYGTSQISALTKLSKLKYSTTDAIIGDTIFASPFYLIKDVTGLIYQFVLSVAMEPHPNLNVRYHTIRKKLVQDLRTGKYDTEYKVELEEEIKALERLYDTLNKYNDEDLLNVRRSVNKVLDIVTNNNSDWREVFNPILNIYNF